MSEKCLKPEYLITFPFMLNTFWKDNKVSLSYKDVHKVAHTYAR